MAAQQLVSVVIPMWNSSATVQRALDSVSAQTYRPVEIILVDDCSGDDTVACVEAWRGHPLRIIRQPHNGGPSRARNAGIHAATGEYVAFLDADDIWHAEKLAKQMVLFQSKPGATIVSCGYREIDTATGRMLSPHTESPQGGAEAWKSLLLKSFIATPTVMARRRTLLEVGGFNEDLKVAEDQDLWIRLAFEGEAHWIDEVLVDVYVSAGSFMRRNQSRQIHDLLPMIHRYIEDRRGDLTDAEVRRIIQARHTAIGRSAYTSGDVRLGLKLLLGQIVSGHRPLENIWYLITACPLIQPVKRRLLGADRVG